MKWRVIAGLFCVAGCGLSEQAFQTAFNEELCDLDARCELGPSCPTETSEEIDDCADYDPKAAAECIETLQESTCENWLEAFTTEPGIDLFIATIGDKPGACVEVYDLTECGL